MAGTTYSNLTTDIRNYTEVDSDVFTAAVINRFIEDAEFRIYQECPMDSQRFVQEGTLAADDNTINSPAGALFIRGVEVFNSTANTQGNGTWLEKKDQTYLSEYVDRLTGPEGDRTAQDVTGFPKYYANWDASFWLVAPTPDSTYEITLAYTKQPTSLTDSSVSSTGTYVSNKYQDLLLYGCLVEAYGYLKGPADMLQYYEGSFKRALQSYAIEQQGRRRRDEWQDGTVRTPLKSQSPS